jgi:hypothetical protein
MNGFSFDSSGRATEGFPIRKKDQAFENVRGLDYTHVSERVVGDSWNCGVDGDLVRD